MSFKDLTALTQPSLCAGLLHGFSTPPNLVIPDLAGTSLLEIKYFVLLDELHLVNQQL